MVIGGAILCLTLMAMYFRASVIWLSRLLKSTSGDGELVHAGSFGKVRPAYMDEGVIAAHATVSGQQITTPSWRIAYLTSAIQMAIWGAIQGIGLFLTGMGLFLNINAPVTGQWILGQICVLVVSVLLMSIVPKWTLPTTISRAVVVSSVQAVLMGATLAVVGSGSILWNVLVTY